MNYEPCSGATSDRFVVSERFAAAQWLAGKRIIFPEPGEELWIKESRGIRQLNPSCTKDAVPGRNPYDASLVRNHLRVSAGAASSFAMIQPRACARQSPIAFESLVAE